MTTATVATVSVMVKRAMRMGAVKAAKTRTRGLGRRMGKTISKRPRTIP